VLEVSECRPMSDIPERLLDLQAIDTELDQLVKRRSNLPEHAAALQRKHELDAWEARAAALRGRITELESSIESAEEEGARKQADKERLEAQLKTVIAPREAEALMHEIEGVTARQDELDMAEIGALEEQSSVDDDLTAHLAGERAVRDALASAANELEKVLAEMAGEESTLHERAATARERIPGNVIDRYERVRESQGVAVARLSGKMCEGCYLDLSAAEVDDVKEAAAASGVTDCPQCGRMLVV
jgi:predicted  nucleic acid-binding Zn-ribbon protein